VVPRRAAALAELQSGYSSSTAAAAVGRSRRQSGTAADGLDGSNGASLDDSLAAHFNSIQELSDRQALEELLPRLQELLMEV